MPLTRPLNNNVLIEVLRNDSDVAVADDNASLQFGKVVSTAFSTYHVTASSFGEVDINYIHSAKKVLNPGVVVRWEEFAEGGQTFKEDGKTYALIPWWRLISYEKSV